MDGVVYGGFGSHCDNGPWQGWIAGVTTDGGLRNLWTSYPARGGGAPSGSGIWMSGTGLMSDGPGRIFFTTGNGGAPSSSTPGNSPPDVLAESVVRLQVQTDGGLRAVDFFMPNNAAHLDSWDADLASGGVVGLPEPYFGTAAFPHLSVNVGKEGYVYLLNRDALGGYREGPSQGDAVVARVGPYGGVWSKPAVWPGEGGWIYINSSTPDATESAGGSSGVFRAYRYGVDGSGKPGLSLQTTSGSFGFSSSAPIVTSDGTRAGSALVWIVRSSGGGGGGATLQVYDPTPPSSGTWTPRRTWALPTAAKFNPPGVGINRLYVGTREGHVLGFGSPIAPAMLASAVDFGPVVLGQSSNASVTFIAQRAVTVTAVTTETAEFTPGT